MKKNRIIVMFVLAIVLLGGVVTWSWFRNLANRVFVSPVASLMAATASGTIKRPVITNVVEEKLNNQKPVNFLLLGYGGGNHDGAYLTDSIIVLNLNPILSKATLITIPRDIWVGDKKVNALYSLNIKDGAGTAGRAAMDAVSAITGLEMDRFVSVSFDGFKKTIDAVGGVDVQVDVTFDDYQYPIQGMENDLCGKDPADLPAITATASATKNPELIFPCRYKHLHFDAGKMHMNGEMALEFVRSRHSAEDGSDFGRARRQKNLLLAVKQKMLSINFLSTALPFVNKLGEDVRTDMSMDEARTLVTIVGKLAEYKTEGLVMTDDNFLQSSHSTDGQYILIPKAGRDDWSQVHTWVFESLAKKP